MLVTLGLVALAILVIDQIAKYLVVTNLVEGSNVPVLGDVLVFHFVKNSGAAFSLGAGYTWIFSIIASAVAVAVIWFSRRLRSLGWAIFLGLLLGGLLGNLTDRLFREPSFGVGHVVDFISTPWLIPAIYNIADIAICAAMTIFVILTLRGINIDGTRATREPKGADADKPSADESAV
ncbi:signal peptidase II [Microbacteriaceae bacterium VKM Ac-2855]|nr:signal peptidase II [Microbacteriaceae bacterium VKM Ac-2855]